MPSPSLDPSPRRPETAGRDTAPPLPILTGASLVSLAPPAPALRGPVAPGTLTLIRGPRGAGKSWLALSLAHAIAGGAPLLGWSGCKAPVLYVEAAMSQASITRRLHALGPVPSGFGLLCERDFDLGLDLEAAQLAQHLPERGGGVLVLDGLSLLVPPGRGAAWRWDAFAQWLRDLRRAGHAVVLVDHIRRPLVEDLADTVLAVKPMHEDQADIALSIHIASREPLAKADRLFAARLDLRTGAAQWTRAALVDPALQAVADQAATGATVRDIAETLGLSVTTAWRRLEKAKAAGLVTDDKPPETSETRPAAKPAETSETTPATGKVPETGGTAPACKPGETSETKLAQVSTGVLQRTLEKRLAARRKGNAAPAGPAILAGFADAHLLAECAARVPPPRADRLRQHFAPLLAA